MFDRLLYVDTLKSAGIPEDHARAHAAALQSALLDTVATKDDISALRTDMEKLETSLRNDMAKLETGFRNDMEKLETGLRNDMEKLETGLRNDMEKLELSLRGEMGELRTAFRGEFAQVYSLMGKSEASLRAEIAAQKTEILRWMFAMMVGFSGLMITAMKIIR